ncbi:hypothetical protein AAF712_012474 [Marasmius tenuissimus]|uniref:MYND-type domain-containing protein n=1 Tax=Marasmius tenuissimus TaxID=585030 RepID=A0ABR2ZHK6_9AGAR
MSRKYEFPNTRWEKGSYNFSKGNREFPISKPAQYIYTAVARYPTPARAIGALKKLGPPPTKFNISHPSLTLQCVCQILAAMASHMKAQRAVAASQVRINWVSVLDPWVDFLLRNFIIGPDRPTTAAGMNVFECSITAISAIIDLPDGKAKMLKNVSPNLQHLVTQAWYLLVDIDHANWGPWSCALVSLAHSDVDPEMVAQPPPPPEDPNCPVLYKEDAELGKILLRHLTTRVQRLRTMPNEEFSFFKAYLMLLTMAPQCFSDMNPIYLRTHIRGTLAASLDMISTLLPLKRKTLETKSIDSQEYKDAHDLVLLSLMTLDRCMHDPIWVEQVLQGGFIRSIFLADRRYLEMDEKHKTRPEGRIAEWAGKVLDYIANYLVYPQVLRQFVRYSKREALEPEVLKEKGSISLWKSWKNAVGKSEVLYDLRQMLKEEGLCSNTECPLEGKAPEECRSLRYRRCLGCKSVMYCSLACRKTHWKEEHRAVCSEIAEMKSRGRSPMTQSEVNFFGHLLKSYLQAHSSVFDHIIQNARLEPADERHPIAFIDFDVPDFPSIEKAELLHPLSLGDRIQDQYQWGSRWTETLVKTWEETDGKQLLVLAAFAKSQFSSWPHAIVVDFPFGNGHEHEHDHNHCHGSETAGVAVDGDATSEALVGT